MYKIGDVVKELRINKETIRYYEKIGLLKNIKKDSNGYRIYNDDDIKVLQFVLLAKEYNFTLKEIDTLLKIVFPEISGLNKNQILDKVNNKISEIDRKIEELSVIKNVLIKVKDNVLVNENICYFEKSMEEILKL
ncbi:MAG: MerR family transcriptional regulator [Sarcina sp.]